MTIGSGPCLWPDLTQTCCPDFLEFSPAVTGAAINYATSFVWMATGRQFGLCELTVRPCGRFCQDCPAGWFYDGYGSFQPYVFNGQWKNCWCGQDAGCCNCDPACQVYLPGPVHSIERVTVDGATLPTTGAYFVLDQMWLVRVDTEACWPTCSDQNLYPGDPAAFEVTYLRGREVPTALAQATSSLACEFARACLGLPCRLPSRITSLSRQGVTVSFADIADVLKNGLSGLWELDQLIMAYNPYGLKGPTRMYSPDLQVPRQVTWP